MDCLEYIFIKYAVGVIELVKVNEFEYPMSEWFMYSNIKI